MPVPGSLLDKPGLHAIGEALAAAVFYATRPENAPVPFAP